jgi:hypothetical protein
MADFQSSINQQRLLDLLKMLKEGQRDSQGQSADQQSLDEELSNLRRTSSVTGDNFVLKGKPTPSGKTGTEFMEPKEFYPPAKTTGLDVEQFGSPMRGANPQGEPYSDLPIVRPSSDVIETTGRVLPDSSGAAESSLGLAGLLAKPGVAPGVAGLAAALYPNTANAGADETGLPTNIPKLKQAFDLAQNIDFKNLPLPEQQKIMARFGSNAPANTPTSSEMTLPQSADRTGMFNRRVDGPQGENLDQVLRNLPVNSPSGGLSALSRYKALMDNNDSNSVAGNNTPPSAPNSNKPTSSSPGVPSPQQNRVPATITSPSQVTAGGERSIPAKSSIASTNDSSNSGESSAQADNGLSDLAKQYKALLDKMGSSQKDFSDKYTEAKKNEQNYNLMTDLAKAAGQIGAGFASTAGTGQISVDNSTLDKLQQSFTPTKDLMTQRAAEQQTLKDSLDKYYKLMEDQRKDQFENRKLKQTGDYQRAMLGLKGQEITGNQALRQAIMNHADSAKDQQIIAKGILGLGKDVGNSGMINYATDLNNLTHDLKQKGVDIFDPKTYKAVEGTGPMGALLPQVLQSDSGARIKSLVSNLILERESNKGMLGRISDQKTKQLKEAMGANTTGSAKVMFQFLKDSSDELKQKAATIEASYGGKNSKVAQAYKDAGGVLPSELLNPPSSSSTDNDFVRIQAPDGTIAPVLKDKAEKYVKMGGKIVP